MQCRRLVHQAAPEVTAEREAEIKEEALGAFAALDRNMDGVLTVDEVNRVSTGLSIGTGTGAFVHMDTDGDQKVTQEEFVTWWKKNTVEHVRMTVSETNVQDRCVAGVIDGCLTAGLGYAASALTSGALPQALVGNIAWNLRDVVGSIGKRMVGLEIVSVHDGITAFDVPASRWQNLVRNVWTVPLAGATQVVCQQLLRPEVQSMIIGAVGPYGFLGVTIAATSPLFLVGPINLLLLFTKDGRTLNDRVAETWVVNSVPATFEKRLERSRKVGDQAMREAMKRVAKGEGAA